MTSGLRRTQIDYWTTSDGQDWEVWREATDHERFLAVRAEVDLLLRMAITSPDVFARALLASDRLLILNKHSPQRSHK